METVRTTTSLNFIMNVLTFCGFWMPAFFAGTWKAVLYGMFSCFMLVDTLVIHLITESIDIYVNLGDMEKNMDTAFLAITLFVALVKATKIITEQKRIQKILDTLDEPNFSHVSKVNSKYLFEAMNLTNLYTKLLTCSAVGTVTLWSVFPLFDKSGEHKLPLRAWYPWDRNVPSTFIMLYAYQVTTLGVLAFLNSAQDVLICSLVILICGQLDVLYFDISALGTDDDELGLQNNNMDIATGQDLNEKLPEAEDVKLKLRRYIIHQKDIINCVEEIEELFSGAIFVQFLASCIVICATAFKLSLTPFSIEFMSNMFYMLTILVELFLFCYPGNELVIKSERISEAAYNNPWYNQDIAFRKMLILVMERSKRPITVTAGRIMPLTLRTLTSILRSSYSFYAVLRTMHDV